MLCAPSKRSLKMVWLVCMHLLSNFSVVGSYVMLEQDKGNPRWLPHDWLIISLAVPAVDSVA